MIYPTPLDNCFWSVKFLPINHLAPSLCKIERERLNKNDIYIYWDMPWISGFTLLLKPPTPLRILRSTLAKDGVRGLYSGCSALVLGNGLKAGVRFLSYDKFKSMLVNDQVEPTLTLSLSFFLSLVSWTSLTVSWTHHTQGKLTGPRSLLAGLGAGMLEAILAVTPSETIKTKLVNESMRPQPRFSGLIQGTREIVRMEGLAGIYRGLFPVVCLRLSL